VQLVKNRFRLGLGGKYLLFVVGLVLIVVSISFTKLFEIEKNFILTQLEGQARFLCRQILLTRSWVADQGGVYVEARPGRKANPYLARGIVETVDGRRLLLRNPAMVTRELSEYAARRSLYRFRLTSTHLINRDNAPDGVERRALEVFRQGRQDEYSLMQTLDGEPVFRYIKALYIEPACLQCHCYQGYKEGQLRGCLSVIIPSAAAQARIAGLHRSLLCDGGLIILLILLVLVLLNHFLTVRPLKRLNRQVRKFERDVNAVVRPLPRSDELGTLSQSLAQMSQTIRDQHKSMEKRVERATENLRRVNRELVEANRSLKQQDALKTDFLATVSHELRTPLTTIRGGVDYLLQTISDPDQQGYLRLLERNIENLVEMVNNLIDLARIDLRRIELEIEEIDLKALLEDVIILFAAGAEEKGIGIAARGELPRVVIEGDYRRLNQIFMNLVHNAVKFSPAGQQVEVELVEREEKVEIRIIDHGIGITPEEIEEIFTRYRFGHQGGERVGSGLGLAIARGLVEAHGGILKVTSQPGVETVFTVILPRRQREEGDGEKT
jgi:signal transduction histidine kinase